MTTHTHSEAKERLKTERLRLCNQLKELGATETGELRTDVDYGDGFADAASATAERTETIGLAARRSVKPAWSSGRNRSTACRANRPPELVATL